MTKKRRREIRDEQLADYVRQCADIMGLRDWVFFVSSDPNEAPTDGVDAPRCATFAGTIGRKGGSIWFDAEYVATAARKDLRQTVAHELVHAHLHQTREFVALAITSRVLFSTFDTISEYAVDALGDVIALALPLPPA